MYDANTVVISRKILENDSLNGREKLALIVLSDTSQISYDDLAKRIGVSKPTAVNAVKSLENKGLLKRISRRDKEKLERSNTNKYFVTI